MGDQQGAPRQAYADPEFVIVRMTAVRALGSWEAAGCFQRIAWRCERDGYWRASMTEIAAEIGVSERTAKRITATLRNAGWVTAAREQAYDATLTWRIVWADQPESANLALSGVPDGNSREGQNGTRVSATLAPSESAKLALSPSSKTTKTDETTTSEADAPDPVRADVEAICKHLADRIEANGCKRPTITARWRDAARLLIDRDGKTPTQIHKCIDWCQDSEFWRANIMSMPTLREKYERLRLQAQRDQHPSNVHRSPDSAERAAVFHT